MGSSGGGSHPRKVALVVDAVVNGLLAKMRGCGWFTTTVMVAALLLLQYGVVLACCGGIVEAAPWC